MDWVKIGTSALAAGIIAAAISAFLSIHFLRSDDGTGGGALASGAVVAFNGSESCPAGWKVYAGAAGRVIVGAGNAAGNKDEMGKTLTSYNAGKTAGLATTVLTTADLPPHTHQYYDIFYSEKGGTVTVPNNRGSEGSDSDNKGYQITRTTLIGKTGASAFTNLPPFIALQYCVKA